jgi:hypothetical protein
LLLALLPLGCQQLQRLRLKLDMHWLVLPLTQNDGVQQAGNCLAKITARACLHAAAAAEALAALVCLC